MAKPKLNKRCPICNSLLQDKNKTGFCKKHRDCNGINNSFYGKHHKQETINKARVKCSAASKKLWESPEYREKVIKGVSKPRRESFKKEQSKRIKEWYENNPEQREIRRKSMSKNWKCGIITKNNNSCNCSKIEQEFFDRLVEIYPSIEKRTLHYKKSWLFPDILVEDSKIIIEFYGNFWHANPRQYQPDDLVVHFQTAQEIWDRDEARIQKFNELGYQVYIVWEDEFKQSPQCILTQLDHTLNWESCSL